MDIGSESRPRRRGRARFNSLAGKLVASRTFERRVVSSTRRFRHVRGSENKIRFRRRFTTRPGFDLGRLNGFLSSLYVIGSFSSATVITNFFLPKNRGSEARRDVGAQLLKPANAP